MKDFIITEYNFISKKLVRPVCIAMLADLHNRQYGDHNERLLAAINNQRPDFIMLAGDMIICREQEKVHNLRTADFVFGLSKIAPVIYGIGNHEKGVIEEIRETNGVWKEYIQMLSSCPNIHILQDGKLFLQEYNICIYGLDLELAYYKRIVMKKLDKTVLYTKLGTPNPKQYSILLAHNPDYYKVYKEWNADLILSGHNHGGMIRLGCLGGLVSPRLHPFPKYDYGLYEDKNKKNRMIVTSGCGFHSIPLRINNPPELCVLHIQNTHPILK